MKHFGQQLPTFGPQELIDVFVGFCESAKSKSVSASHSVFQMGSLCAWNLRKPQIREVWKLVKSVYLNIVVTVWSLKDLIFVHNETWVVNWVLLEHMGLCSLICVCLSRRRSICMCWQNQNVSLSGARWNDGFSGNYTPFLWGISQHSLTALLAWVTGRRSSGGGNRWKEWETKADLGAFPLAKISIP